MVRYASPLFVSSGDLIADRRYDHAMALRARGDLQDAADLMDQALALAPRFASAWFALGAIRAELGDWAGAVAAFRAARDVDPQDRHGAALCLARLGAGDLADAMSPAYLRGLFDQYAPRFDDALSRLSYRAPAVLRDAVAAACRAGGRSMRFGTMLDLCCGTGLGGAAFRPSVDWLAGVDLSPGMIAQARAKGLYDRLAVADIGAFLAEEAARDAAYHLTVAADVFVYLVDLAPVIAAVARVLAPDGLFAFTVETHPGEGAILGEKLRYAHGAAHVRAAAEAAGLGLIEFAEISTRMEGGAPVPGLLVVAAKTQGLDRP
jgi:predicted TPR repeat methyltransferase